MRDVVRRCLVLCTLSLSGELILSICILCVAESITTDCRTFWPHRPLSAAHEKQFGMQLTEAYEPETTFYQVCVFLLVCGM